MKLTNDIDDDSGEGDEEKYELLSGIADDWVKEWKG